MTPKSLYIHVPFCARRCSYCDFAVQATSSAPTGEWLSAILGELALVRLAEGWHEPLTLETLYVGGGTPSMLASDAMAGLAAGLSQHAEWRDGIEWTVEANPESFEPGKARAWRGAGVNRISLGAQTFHEPTLRWMGRIHGPDGPAAAVNAARAAGIEDISIDLIFGVPSRLGRDWRADLDRALALEPEHISLYGLTAEKATPLGRWVAEGRETLADEDRYADEYLIAHERLTAEGFEHYEVSNFARPGRRSRHNSAYWAGSAYAALGPGAHAYSPPVRRWNLRGWDAYREAVGGGRIPEESREIVDEETAALEGVWLGLRTADGLRVPGSASARRELIGVWERQGWAVIRKTPGGGWRVRLTAEGWLRLDRLAVDLAAVD